MSEKLNGLSMDIESTEQEKLRAVFPQCFVEGKLDERKLLELLGTFNTLDENDREKYEFRWKGKQEAMQLAGKRSAGTLRPCPEESVDWENTRNLYIEGDNLEVLKLLQTAYYGRVKMIYIDPPYNTGNDFVYADDFADPLARYREVTQQTTKSNPETMGRFHTNWLNMMYPRLRLAANLLRDDGVIFISIDDNEVHNLRKLCDEVFGEENFVAQIAVQVNPRGRHLDRFVAKTHEYLLIYCRAYGDTNTMRGLPKEGKMIEEYNQEDEQGKFRLLGLRNRNQAFNPSTRPNLYYPLYVNPEKRHISLKQSDEFADEVWPDTPDGIKTCWTWSTKKVEEENHLLIAQKTGTEWRIYRKDYLLGESGQAATTLVKSLWAEAEMNNDYGRQAVKDLLRSSVMDFPKPIDLIKRAVITGTAPDAEHIILDFFSGSASTAHAVMQLNAEDGGNRRFICVQLPEVCDEKSEAAKAGYSNICEIGKERIRRAGAKIASEAGMLAENLDTGFRVFKLDSSNLKLWDDTPITGDNALAELEARIRGMLDIIKPDRSEQDLVYEIMLKLGQDLCEPIVPIDLGGKTVYGVGVEVKFIVCLAPGITPEDAAAMAEYAPGRIIFADACFENSEQKSNVRLTLKDLGIAIKAL